MNRVDPSPMTGMKPGFPRTRAASSETNPSPGPKITEGRKIVQESFDALTARSPAALVRAYSDGASSELPIALMCRSRRTPAPSIAADDVLGRLPMHPVEGLTAASRG